jgi:hypothetical protein
MNAESVFKHFKFYFISYGLLNNSVSSSDVSLQEIHFCKGRPSTILKPHYFLSSTRLSMA